MSAPFTGTNILLVARFDEKLNYHNQLRRRALERLGCSVATLDPEQTGWLAKVARADLRTRLLKALEQRRPDLVLVIGCEQVNAWMVQELKSKGSGRWVNWFPGDLRSLGAMQSLQGAYDHLFVEGTDLASHLGRAEGKRVSYLPPGCDPSVHKPMRARGPFRANVVFAGTATPERERLLSEVVEFGLALWGQGWRKSSLRDYCRGELPTAEDYVRAYAGASIAVNIHRTFDRDPAHDSRGVNQRVFELAAIGVAQVVDRRGDLEGLFEDGTHVLVFQTPTELKGLVKRALQEDSYRERLAAAARQQALQFHTYMHRMTFLLENALTQD